MQVAKRLSKEITDNRSLRDKLDLRNNKIKELNDKISVLQNENSELESALRKWEKMQEQGYTACAINEGYIMEAVTVPAYCVFTFSQDIPKDIGSKQYYRNPFAKLKNGKIVFDTQKYKKFRGGF